MLVYCAEHENAEITSNLTNLLVSVQQALKQISLQEQAGGYPWSEVHVSAVMHLSPPPPPVPLPPRPDLARSICSSVLLSAWQMGWSGRSLPSPPASDGYK